MKKISLRVKEADPLEFGRELPEEGSVGEQMRDIYEGPNVEYIELGIENAPEAGPTEPELGLALPKPVPEAFESLLLRNHECLIRMIPEYLPCSVNDYNPPNQDDEHLHWPPRPPQDFRVERLGPPIRGVNNPFNV